LKPFDVSGNFQTISSGDGLRRSAVRGAGASIVGQAFTFGVQMASVVVLARLLTPADFGIVTMVTTFSLMFRSFGMNGFTELIMQREELSNDFTSNLFWINLGIGTFLTVVFASAGPLLANFYHNAAVVQVTEGLSLTIGIGSLGWIHLALLQRAMHFRTTAIISVFSQIALVAASIILTKAGWHYWALVWGIVIQSVATAAAAWVACRWTPSLPRRASGTGAGLKFAINVYAHFAFSHLTRNTDNMLVGWRFGASALGFYKKAYDLFVMAETQLLAPISAVAVSTLSRVSRNREQFQRYFLRGMSVLALLGMGIGADLALIGGDLIRLLLGPGWEEAGRIFSLFGPGIGVMLLYNTHGWIHLSIGRPERWFRWGLMEFACTGTLFLLALRWGPSGIAFAWTASFFILMFPGFSYAGKPIGLGIRPMLGVIWKFFLASVLAGVSTFLIIRAIPQFTIPVGASGAFERMVSVSLIYFSLYFGAVVALHRSRKPLTETIELFRDFLPQRAVRPAFASGVDSQGALAASAWGAIVETQADSSGHGDSKPRGL
jgi:O-antigen/teichoic acid export membrane protein